MKKFLALSLGIVLIAVACNKAPATSNSTNSSNNNQSSSNQAQTGTAEIDMTADGFSPANITVKAGIVVVFKNTGTSPRWPASNPHPTHTDLPGFDPLRGIGAGEGFSFTFTKVGTWKFHDHLNPTQGGSVTVVE